GIGRRPRRARHPGDEWPRSRQRRADRGGGRGGAGGGADPRRPGPGAFALRHAVRAGRERGSAGAPARFRTRRPLSFERLLRARRDGEKGSCPGGGAHPGVRDGYLLRWKVIQQKVPVTDVVSNELIDEVNRFDAAAVAAEARAWK